MKQTITIILPLYKRSPYLCTLIENLLAQSEFPAFHLLVADGSPAVIAQQNQDILTSFCMPNISYFYYGEDLTFNHYIKKLNYALSLVKTPFTFLLDQDDLFSLKAIQCHEQYLLRNTQYIGSRSRSICLASRSLSSNIRCLRLNVLSLYPHLPKHNIQDDQSFIDAFQSDQWNSMYCLFRTEFLLALYEAFSFADIRDINAWEFFFHYYLYTMGPIAVIDNPKFYAYVRREGSSTLTAGLNANQSLQARVNSPSFYDSLVSIYQNQPRCCIKGHSISSIFYFAMKAFESDSSFHKLIRTPLPLRGIFHITKEAAAFIMAIIPYFYAQKKFHHFYELNLKFF